MKKGLISIIVIMTMFLSILPCKASTNSIVTKARVLYDLGLLKGTSSSFSEEGLDLKRRATRAEACTSIVRMLGKEAKANYQANPHPFRDVPEWADNNIGYLYENYLVNGKSELYFGANDIATVQQFCAMLLRVLGFSETKWDFTYDNAVQFAKKYGLLTDAMAKNVELPRDVMIEMCYNALRLNIKNSNRSLIKKLCDEKAVSESLAKSKGLMKEASIDDSFADVKNTLGSITVKKMGRRYRITFKNPAEEYGLRVYVLENGGVIKEITQDGDPYMEKGKINYPSGSAAGYVDTIDVYGLDTTKTYSFIVIKTSSEGEIYKTLGKSGVYEA